MKKVVALVVFILIAEGAFADPTVGSAQWLEGLWNEYQRTSNNSMVGDAYMSGVYTGFVMGAILVPGAEGYLSVPPSATVGQWCAVVGKYLENNPQEWNLPAIRSVLEAAYAVWPGPKKPPL